MLLLRGATVRKLGGTIQRIVSIHAPLARSNKIERIASFNLYVSIHAPLARSNFIKKRLGFEWSVSIHAPLARSNSKRVISACHGMFQYMLLLRGATQKRLFYVHLLLFQYMLLLRGATFPAGSNFTFSNWFQYMLLLRGATLSLPISSLPPILFQYMLLLRGATKIPGSLNSLKGGFNTCSSCEEQRAGRRGAGRQRVSIHAPLARSNRMLKQVIRKIVVSIHAPLARSNILDQGIRIHMCRFNTCSSCEEQPSAQLEAFRKLFVSIHAPLARSNYPADGGGKVWNVSIHAPLARSNVIPQHPVPQHRFQYMLLLRGATGAGVDCVAEVEVSIHAPLARSNLPPYLTSGVGAVSIHAPLARSNVVFFKRQAVDVLVSIHAPLARSNYVLFQYSQSHFKFQYMLLLRGAT